MAFANPMWLEDSLDNRHRALLHHVIFEVVSVTHAAGGNRVSIRVVCIAVHAVIGIVGVTVGNRSVHQPLFPIAYRIVGEAVDEVVAVRVFGELASRAKVFLQEHYENPAHIIRRLFAIGCARHAVCF